MMAQKRHIAVFLILFVGLCAIVASSHLEVETSHFKIIYEPECYKSASLIASSCEEQYSYLCTLFGLDPNLKIPVVITSEYKVLNAYYTSYPSNRIVLFDTVPNNGSLSNYPNTLLYVFRHELSHAFTMNIRSNFWQYVSNVFGDIVSIAPLLYTYPSMAEGVAVLCESMDGYGRLNDLYATSIVRQAKLEGLFPSWIDIAGAMDTYPSSSLPYIFGGAFLLYLSNEYGSDKVFEAFKNFGKINWFNDTATIIENVIGVPFDVLWVGFYNSIETPSNLVYGSSLECLSKGSADSKGSYDNFTLSSTGEIFFVDWASYSLLKIDENLSDVSKVASIAPYGSQGSGIDVSKNNNILVPFISSKSSSVKVLNSKGRTLATYSFKDRDVRGGCFVENTSFCGVLLYTAKGQETYLELYEVDKDFSLLGEPISVYSLGYGIVASDFTSFDEEKVAFILVCGNHYNLAVLSYDVENKSIAIEVLDNPKGIIFKSLSKGFSSVGDSIFSFCWYPSQSSGILNDSSSFGRYGEFYPASMTFRLSYTNVFGGVCSPLRLGDTILFSSAMYNGDCISEVSIESLNLSKYLSDFEELGYFLYESPTLGDIEFIEDSSDFIENSSKYSYFANLKRGVLFPFGMYGSFISSSEDEDIGLGLTWLSSDPTSTVSVAISSLYSNKAPSLWASLSLSGLIDFGIGTGAKLLLDEEFNAYGYSFSFMASAGKSFDVSSNGTLSLNDTFSFTLAQAFEEKPYIVLSNLFQVSYSYAVATGLGHYDVFGYSVSLALEDIDPYVAASLVLPSLIPIKCARNFTYNLPFRLDFISCYFVEEKEIALSASAKTTVFSYEIQKGCRCLGLYFKRISLDVKYNALYLVFANAYAHNLEAYAHLYLTPVLGMYATQLNLGLGAKLVWDFTASPKVELSFVLN